MRARVVKYYVRNNMCGQTSSARSKYYVRNNMCGQTSISDGCEP